MGRGVVAQIPLIDCSRGFRHSRDPRPLSRSSVIFSASSPIPNTALQSFKSLLSFRGTRTY